MPSNWLPEELEYLGRCPLCQSPARTLVHPGLSDKLFNCSEDRWDLHACGSCATHYLDPRPNKDTIGRAYTSYLTHQAPGSTAPGKRSTGLRGCARRLVQALANGYRNRRWGTRLEPQYKLGRYLVPCIPLLRDTLHQQFRSLPKRSSKPSGKLLDVGCGNGAYLQLAQSAGWVVQGLDFDHLAVAAARHSGLEVQQGGLAQLEEIAPASFDRVTLSHVLEHVHDPVSWLQALKRVLVPGGTLWLQTPNIDSLGHARFNQDWRDLDPPRHLTLWTYACLRQKLAEAGFREIRRLRTPTSTAMEVYASSEGISHGMDYATFAALPGRKQRPLRHLLPAILQHWSLRRAEFHTVIATR